MMTKSGKIHRGQESAGRKKKIKNAVCFFASEHERLTRRPLPRTFLYKYLSFLDFTSLEKTGRPALGVLYRRIENGMVSNDTQGKQDILKNECFALVPEAGGRYVVKAVAKPDLRYFSRFELKEMRKLLETYADQFIVMPDNRGAMSFQNQARVIKTAVTDHRDMIEDGSRTKHKEVHAMSGLQLLTEKYVARLKELEAQLADVKHKLEIVMEASRLLKEEGLSEDSRSPFGEKTF